MKFLSEKSNIIIITMVLVSVFGTIFALFFGEKFSVHESYRNDVFSYSAIGHHGFYETLKTFSSDVTISESDEGLFDVMIIAEPKIAKDEDRALQSVEKRYNSAILFLPKRRGTPNDKGNHIRQYELVPEAEAIKAMQPFIVSEFSLSIVRRNDLVVSINRNGFSPPVLRDPVQLVLGLPKENIIYGDPEKGALVFYDSKADGTVNIVISDPDIIANHGIDEKENYEFIKAFFAIEFPNLKDLKVGIDETVHGYRQRPSLLRLLTSFPLSIFTIQLLLLLVVVTWRGLIRFGTPVQQKQKVAMGPKGLIENTASLFAPNHATYLGKAYTLSAIQDVAKSMGAPLQLTQNELWLWLDDYAKANDIDFRVSKMMEEFDDFEYGGVKWKPRDIVAIAQKVDKWRRDMTS